MGYEAKLVERYKKQKNRILLGKNHREDFLNKADYYAKRHPIIYHRTIKKRYVEEKISTFTHNTDTICNTYCNN